MIKQLTFIGVFCALHFNTLFAQKGGHVFIDQGLYGMRDASSEVIIQPTYKYLGWSDSSEYISENAIGYLEGSWGLLSTKGKRLTKPIYYDLRWIDGGLIVAGVKGKFSNRIFYGILNEKGKTVLGFNYTRVEKVNNALLITEVRDEQKFYGLMDLKRRFLLDPEYLNIQAFGDKLFTFQTKEGRHGIINGQGDKLIPATLDSIGGLVDGQAMIFQAGKIGLINALGAQLLTPDNKRVVFSLQDSTMSMTKFAKWSVINTNNQTLAQFECDSMDASAYHYFIYRNKHVEVLNPSFDRVYQGYNVRVMQNLGEKFVIEQNRKWGVVGQDDVFVSVAHDSIYSDSNYYYIKKRNEWSVINKYGRQITSKKYDDLRPESEGLIATQKNGYWGFIDFQGDEVIPHKYDRVEPFRNRSSKVRFLNSYGTINHFGEWICEPVYDDVTISTFGLTMAKMRTRTDLLNQAGNVVFQTFNELTLHEIGFLEETEEGDKGLIAGYGGLLLYPTYKRISNLVGDTLIIVESESGIGAINRWGKWLIPLTDRFQGIYGINEGLISIKKDGSHGFVDTSARLRIANRYDSVGVFNEGMASIKLRGNWGYIDSRERLRIQPAYEVAGLFHKGHAVVKERGRYGLINAEGKYVAPPEFESIQRTPPGLFKVLKNENLGLFDSSGNKIVSPKYTTLQVLSEDFYIAYSRGKAGLLNRRGLFTIAQIYDFMKSATLQLYLCKISGEATTVPMKRAL